MDIIVKEVQYRGRNGADSQDLGLTVAELDKSRKSAAAFLEQQGYKSGSGEGDYHYNGCFISVHRIEGDESAVHKYSIKGTKEKVEEAAQAIQRAHTPDRTNQGIALSEDLSPRTRIYGADSFSLRPYVHSQISTKG